MPSAEFPPDDQGLRRAALVIGKGIADGMSALCGKERRLIRVTAIIELIDPDEQSASSTFVVVPAPSADAAETIRAILTRSLEGVDEYLADGDADAVGETHDVSRVDRGGTREDLQ